MSIQIIFLAHQNKRVKKPSKYKENVYLFSLIILENSLSPFFIIHYDNIIARQSLLIPYNKTFFCCIFAWFFYLLLVRTHIYGGRPKHNKTWIQNEGKSKGDEEEKKKRKHAHAKAFVSHSLNTHNSTHMKVKICRTTSSFLF